ncbi:CU044_5270 family protein [Actinacidiphila acididurans]|uniref:CU044_5270 family protein n=1 Tax=Actinacidiphila acididurans TaxID=2784346 RepID=A0ABS2TJT6_9ACTN|nr:CU044_5270 family protein [Actinacidiphila acididurans]MBM9503601.1 CU044_5270 family protein [Actinacidiphila acididurans]
MAEPTELTALRALRADAPAADTSQLAAGRWRLMAAARAETAPAPDRFPRIWFPRSRALRRGLVAGATAAAVAAGVLTFLPRGAGPGGAADGGPGTQTVQTVLAAAARTAQATRQPVPGPRQWLYESDVVCQPTCTTETRWFRGDGKYFAHQDGTNGKVFVDAVMLSREGRPVDFTSDLRTTYRKLSALPTEPHALLKELQTDPFFANRIPMGELKRGKDGKVIKIGIVTPPTPPARTILILLETVPAIPPHVSAALYRALALVPGARLSGGPVKDALGRPGVGISFLLGPQVSELLILDPKTYAYLGSRTQYALVPRANVTYTRKATGIVDRPGQLPGRSPAPSPAR